MNNNSINREDVEAIKALNFLRIPKTILRSWLYTGLMILGVILIAPLWSEKIQQNSEGFDYWDYLKRVYVLFLLGLIPITPWLIDLCLIKIELLLGIKKVINQRLINKILIGYLKFLRFEGKQFIIYRKSASLQKLKSGDLIRGEWTALNRLIRFELLESKALHAQKPVSGFLHYNFGLASSWMAMVAVVPFIVIASLYLVFYNDWRSILGFLFFGSPFIIIWTYTFGLLIDLKNKRIIEYNRVLGLKINKEKRYHEINEVFLAYKAERKMSYNPHNYGPYIIHWFDVNIRYNDNKILNVLSSEDKEDASLKAQQLSIDLKVSFYDQTKIV